MYDIKLKGAEYLPWPAKHFSPDLRSEAQKAATEAPKKGEEAKKESDVELFLSPIEGDFLDLTDLHPVEDDGLLLDLNALADDDQEPEAIDYGEEKGDEEKEDENEKDGGAELDDGDMLFGNDVIADDLPEDDLEVLKDQAVGAQMKHYEKVVDRPVKRLNPRDMELRRCNHEHLSALITLLAELVGVDPTPLIPKTDDTENRILMRINIINLRDRIEGTEQNYRFLLQKLTIPMVDFRPSDTAYFHPLMEAMTTPRKPLPKTLDIQVQKLTAALGDEIATKLHEKFSSNFAAFQATGQLLANVLATHKESDRNQNVYLARAARLFKASLVSTLPQLYNSYMKLIEDHVKAAVLTAAMQRAGVTIEDLH